MWWTQRRRSIADFRHSQGIAATTTLGHATIERLGSLRHFSNEPATIRDISRTSIVHSPVWRIAVGSFYQICSTLFGGFVFTIVKERTHCAEPARCTRPHTLTRCAPRGTF